MRLIHLTDPHLTTPPHWRTLAGRSHFGKRFLGYASWARKRRHRMRRPWLDELVAAVREQAPDKLLISGDLTQIGTEEEIVEARQWLEQLAEVASVALVPGNHDTYARESWPTLQREWAAFLPEAGAEGFPRVWRLEDVALFGLSSAVPTAPLSASGQLGAAQRQRLAARLAEHEDACRFLLLHHPPLPGMISHRKRLTDAPALEALLAAQPVAVILHGHHHRNEWSERQGARVYCTASAAAEAASFRVFDVARSDSGWQLQTTLHRRAGGHFEVAERAAWQVTAPG